MSDTKPDIVRRLCEAVVRRLRPPRVIYDRLGRSPYLSRWYLLGGPRTDGEAFDQHGATLPGVVFQNLPINIYVHRFHRSDDDSALHNHPWRWSVSFILAGGYTEERRDDTDPGDGYGRVVTREVRPGSVNVIRDSDFHRVDLLEHDAWSIFVAGPKSGSWGFWDRWTGEYLPWREFIGKLRQQDAEC